MCEDPLGEALDGAKDQILQEEGTRPDSKSEEDVTEVAAEAKTMEDAVQGLRPWRRMPPSGPSFIVCWKGSGEWGCGSVLPP